MPSELATLDHTRVVRVGGMTAARYNDPAAARGMSVAQIREAREVPVPKEVFGEAMTLLCERFDRTMSAPLLRYSFERVDSAMGADEFAAAFYDLMGSECAWHNVVAYLVGHAERQRENGPDLIALGMSEAYRKGDAHDDLS